MAGGSLGTGNVTRQNIIVGPGNLYTAPLGTALPADLITTGNSTANDLFDSATGWTTIGATQGGVEIGYQPEFGEVEVDQLKDAAKMFNQGVTFTFSTQLAEATLTNLALAWGQDSAEVVQSQTDHDRFKICVPDDSPYEFKAVVVGEGAPESGDLDTARERIYVAFRVISVEGSTHSLTRTEATTFPVSFRCLPDPTETGREYGVILDRTVGSAITGWGDGASA